MRCNIICQIIIRRIDKRNKKRQIILSSQGTVQPHLKVYLPFFMVIAFSLIMPVQSMTQKFIDQVFCRPALSLSNQIWLPYHDDYFKTVDKPVVNLGLSFFYESEVNRHFKIRTGFGFKQKGTIKKNYPYPYTGTRYTNYKHFALTGSGELLYFVKGYAVNKLYLIGGLGCDYMMGEKPAIHNWCPANVETHFVQDDYNRWILNAQMGLGVTLSEVVSLEFVSSRALTPGLNVHQLLIRDRFYSLGLYCRIGYPPSTNTNPVSKVLTD